MSTEAPIRRIEPPDWLVWPPLTALLDALGEGRFVGGIVRDTLLGLPPGDLDLATPLPPPEVIRRLAAAGIKTVPTGIDHGTVTAALSDGRPVEITTLRRDVETDGRHATVDFTTDWAADAARRDFTMNALYLDRTGGIWDPIGGIEDCETGRVHFVGEPSVRIDEDVLRVLRFYRFQARYGRVPADPAARAACRARAASIASLAGERLQAETLKLLMAADPSPTVRLIIEDGVLAAYLPPPFHPDRLAALVAIEPKPDPIRRLAALLDDGVAAAERLRLSNADRDRLVALTGPNPIDPTADAHAQRVALYRLGASLYRDFALFAGAPQLSGLAEAWENPALPVGGGDAKALGLAAGPAVGALLRAVEAWWIDGDFRANRAACLERMRALAVLPQV